MTRRLGGSARLWLPWVVAALTALATVAGLRLLTAPASTSGSLLVLASAERPDHLGTNSVALHSASGWMDVGTSPAAVVPVAPQTVTLLHANVPAGSYDSLRVGSDSLQAQITLGPGLLDPVLITVSHGRPLLGVAYVGNDSVSLGLQELSGALPHLPPFRLVDQHGRPFTNAQLGSRLTLLASFHTTCGETCPLVTGLLLQLHRDLPEAVSIAEVTTDPWQDTPAALLRYAGRAGADWTFATGSPDALANFWTPLGVRLDRSDTHVSVLALVDPRGYVLHTFAGVPDLNHALPAALQSLLDAQGRAELASHGDGWGAAQVLDSIGSLNLPSGESLSGGGMAPRWALPGLEGGAVASSSYVGRPLVINFWAAWCTPCRSEMPMLQREVSARTPVALVFIDERDEAASARAFVKSAGITATVALDASGTVGSAYNVIGLPVTVFIRSDGTLEGTYIGAMSAATLATHLSAIAG